MSPDSAMILLLTDLRSRIAELDAENAALREQLSSQAADGDPHRT